MVMCSPPRLGCPTTGINAVSSCSPRTYTSSSTVSSATKPKCDARTVLFIREKGKYARALNFSLAVALLKQSTRWNWMFFCGQLIHRQTCGLDGSLGVKTPLLQPPIRIVKRIYNFKRSMPPLFSTLAYGAALQPMTQLQATMAKFDWSAF